MSSLRDSNVRIFDESTTVIRINDRDNGENFVCDEEPHMLSVELGSGYNPIALGRRLKGKKAEYEIVRKLGWAGHSSVWLAVVCGTSDAISTPTYVAIKVLTIDATAAILYRIVPEDKNFRRVTTANPEHPGYLHTLKLRDVCLEQSNHGPHICFVTDVLGSTMSSLRKSQPKNVFSVSAAQRITQETLLALDYLHRECGLVHADMKPDNTLVRLDQADAAIAHHLSVDPSTTYEPRIEPDLSPDPIITVKSQPLPDFGLNPDLSNLTVQLIDYGQALSVQDLQYKSDVQPILLRAPEVFEYLTGAEFFQLWESDQITFTDVHLKRMMEHIGPFPESFLSACSRRDQYFGKDGQLLRKTALVPRSIDDCLRNYGTLEEKDIAPAAEFIRKCLTIDPTQRPTALELLKHVWLKKDT